jgi:hypothetical protein
MSFKNAALALLAGTALTAAQPAAAGIPHLKHVWVIMMENHGYAEVVNNPYMPWTNAEIASANTATNYYAVAHPSLTNYLEIVGGSNFGITDDNPPDWHDTACQPNIISGINNDEADGTPICPIAGIGLDAPTPAIDYSNETQGPPGVLNIDGIRSYAAQTTTGQTIGDQLVAAGMSWKSYQEDLPFTGADGVDDSDGDFSNLSIFTADEQALGETDSAITALYAVKHNPFAYFASVQSGANPSNSLNNIVAFDGANGLYADLASNHVPAYSFIVPNQCHDQHGRSGYTPFCQNDPNDNGTQNGLNPAIMTLGDQTLQKLVTSIKASPAWKVGNNAIVMVWDESDYSVAPITNQVVMIVDKNYGPQGVQSNKFYTHFNLLNTIEFGFQLPCLNHACDRSAFLMNDLFGN